MKLITFASNASVKRALTIQNVDPSSSKPLLESILGPDKYQALLKIDPAPLVIEMRSIATIQNGPLSFKPKYDLEISRTDWQKFESKWVGKPYTDRHTPKNDAAPVLRGRILKNEMRADGWYNYVYIMPSQDGYKVDLQAEATMFANEIIRSVSTEFYIDKTGSLIEDIGPELIAEVPNPNVAGSGVTGLFNQQSKQELAMERQDVINSLKPEELKDTNVLALIENRVKGEVRIVLASDAGFRKEVLEKLTPDEKKALVNGLSKELLAECTAALGQAEKILNEKAESQKAADKKFRQDVRDMFKAVTKNELDEEKAGYLIVANGWKPGQEAEVKKYIEFHNQMMVEGSSYFDVIINRQKKAVSSQDKPADVPVKSEQTGFAAVTDGLLSLIPGRKASKS